MNTLKVLVVSALLSSPVGYWLAFKSPVFADQMTQAISQDWSIQLWSINHSKFMKCYDAMDEQGFGGIERTRTCKERAYGHPYFDSFDKIDTIYAYDIARFGMWRHEYERKLKGGSD